MLRHDNAADGGTFLSGLGGHLTYNLANEQGELGLFRRHVFSQHAAVQGVGFHGERDRVCHNIRVNTQGLAGAGGAGKRHHILAVEMVQQIARAAADQADGAVRHQTALHDRFHHRLRHLRGGGSGFDDRRHPGKPCGGEFLQHAPAGEVEGVNMYRHARFRCQHMACRKAAFFRQWDQFILGPQRVIR